MARISIIKYIFWEIDVIFKNIDFIFSICEILIFNSVSKKEKQATTINNLR
jgi:hypothetical protein